MTNKSIAFYGTGQKMSYVDSYVNIWVFNQHWEDLFIFKYQLINTWGMSFEVERKGIEKLFKTFRLEPETKSKFLTHLNQLFWM